MISGRNLNSEISRPTLFACHALKDSKILDQPLQFHSVLAQDRRDLPLSALQLTDRAVHQEFGALANIRQRRLQFMRHVSQESILFLREIEQPHPQPLELRREPLQVRRAADGDRPREGAAAELVDGAVDGADRPAEEIRKNAHDREGHRHEQQGLPEQILLRELRRDLQARSAR